MDLVTGALPILPSKLLQLLQDEYKFPKDVRSRVEQICRELEILYAALLNVAGLPWDQLDPHIKVWTRDAREASYDIEDVIDTFLMNIRDNAPSGPSRLLYVKKMSKQLIKFRSIPQISVAIRDIESKLKQLVERRDRYKIDDVVRRPIMMATIDPRLLAMYKKESELIGVDQSREQIISMLMSDNQVAKKISIVGAGGLGKTTLAKVTYDKIRWNYNCCTFVSVGQNPDMVKLFKDILVQLGIDQEVDRYNTLHTGALIDIIRQWLSNKRYLVVVDDVWEEISLKTVQFAFPENDNGSGIIITTRKFEVATIADEVYKLQPLSYEYSQILFYRLIFGAEGISTDKQIDELSYKFLMKCEGIPLAIITMAHLLVGKPTQMWSDLYKANGGFGHKGIRDVEDTMKILSFSYYDLPLQLRTCFVYLSKFPDGHVIDTSSLIWKWIAEGFIQEQKGKRLYEIGEVFFNDLVSRSVIQVVQSEFDNTVQGCRIHSMVLGLIRFLSLEENFVSVLDQEGQPSRSGKPRRLAAHNRKEEHNHGDDINLLPWLRSFTAIECPIYMIPPVSSFKLLRVLDLENCGSVEGYDLNHLGKLHNLRFFGLSNTFVRKLPQELGHLKLQTLELKGSGVEELPANMGELRLMMCLNTDWTTRVPNWIGMLTSLEQLVMYPCGGNNEYSTKWFVEGLGNLRELRVLRLLIKADNEKQLTQLLKSAFELPKIEALHFDYYGAQLNSRVKLEPSIFACREHLRSLELQLLELSRLPVWLNAYNLPKISHLSLLLFDVDKQDLENLGQFRVLHHLHLLIVNTERSDAITCASGGFENLRFFSITKPVKFLQGVMRRLEILDFHFNVRLQSGADINLDFDFGLENIPSLRQVIIQINYMGAFPEEVKEVEASLRHAINIHPNGRLIISLPRQKLDKAKNDGANHDLSNRDKGKRVVTAEGHSKLAYYSKSLSSAHDGIDKPMDELIKRLYVVANEAYNKKMKIVPIVRSEGLGKTTLAQNIFDKLSPHFDCAAFVLVGQNPDMRKVFTDILMGLDKQKYKGIPMNTSDIIELIGLVRKSLINKRFFVVIDDIWDLKAWEIIKCALIENSNGSAVLTTTSRQNWKQQNWWSSGDDKLDSDADKQLDPHSTTTDHSLHSDAATPADVPAFSPSKKPRVEEELVSHEPDSLEFGITQVGATQPEPSLFHGADLKGYFYEKLFGSEDKCPDDLRDICEDLIKISAGILSDAYETVEELRDIHPTLENWQPVYQRRKFDLSYPKLPEYLKNCLGYFSMFPKGYEISAERLVWAWIAQGFIIKETEGQQDLQKKEVGKNYLSDLINRNMTEEEIEGQQDLQKKEVGKSYLSDLINRKMIEAVEVDADGMALSCRAIDLLHDLIVTKSTEGNFVAILNDSQDRAFLPPDKVRRLSIQVQRNNIVHSPPKVWLNQVHSLVVSCDTVPSFTEFRGLQAMDLGGCDSLQGGHLKGIGKTTSLTYLAIGGKYIAAIPKEVSSLKSLRTLDLTASGLSELPRCVIYLTDLKRLFVNSHMKIPGRISKMSGLQELGDINIVKPELLKRLRKLSMLRVLRIAMWSWDEDSKSSVKLWWETLHSLLGSCKNIESLCIMTFCSLDYMDGSDDNKWIPQKLKKLEIRHSAFHHELPSWFDSLANISSLTIEVNKLSTNITNTLGKLSALCSLSLTSKEVPEVTLVINSDTFKKLESLKFVCNAMVQMFAGPQSSNASQQLKKLTIVFQASCTKDKNKNFKFGLENLHYLEQVRVEINCFNASHQMVNDAENAIRKEMSIISKKKKEMSRDGSGSSQVNLEIRRLEKESMVAEDQVARTSSLKTQGNGNESDSTDVFECAMTTTEAEPAVVGQAPMSTAEVVSKVLYHNSSNNTFLKNVGILMISTKIEKSTERTLQKEQSTEQQGSTSLHHEVDELKKNSKITEQALANTQREFEVFKKRVEENNFLLKSILHLNNGGIS